jgi:hypothetical protein
MSSGGGYDLNPKQCPTNRLRDGCLGHVYVKTRLTPTDRSASGGNACSADPWLACKSHGAKSGGDGCREGLDASLMDNEVPNARPTRMKGWFFLRLFFTLCAAGWLKNIFSRPQCPLQITEQNLDIAVARFYTRVEVGPLCRGGRVPEASLALWRPRPWIALSAFPSDPCSTATSPGKRKGPGVRPRNTIRRPRIPFYAKDEDPSSQRVEPGLGRM